MVHIMQQKYNDLFNLIEHDQEANRYYSSLPGYVKQAMQLRAQNVNSIESLQDYAENLLRDDE